MDIYNWPCKPIHITNDKPELDGLGIISNEYLQGIQTSISANLNNPTTIIEYSCNGEQIRTDSTLLAYELHPPCKLFREYTNHRQCHNCDYFHANLFWNLEKHSIREGLEKRIKTQKFITFQKENGNEYKIDSSCSRIFLQYDCPLLGYTELMFPIFYENYLVGTLFVGELCLQSRLDVISKIKNNYKSKNIDCFSDYIIEKNRMVSSDRLWNDIEIKHHSWINNPENIYDDIRFSKLINNTCNEIEKLENILQEQMALKRERYISISIDNIIGKFYENVWEFSQDNNNLKKRWENIKHRLNDLVLTFSVEYALVFGSTDIGVDGHKDLNLIVYSDNTPFDLLEEIETMTFRFDDLPKRLKSFPSTSVKDRNILDGFSKNEKKIQANWRVYSFPVISDPQASIVVVINDNKHNLSLENKQVEEYLDRLLRFFFSSIVSVNTSIIAALTKRNLKSSLRVFGHEVNQQTAGLDGLRVVYLSDSKVLKEATDDKLVDICGDLEGFIRQVSLLSKKADLIYALPQPKKEHFKAYKTLLFKWKDIYRLEATKKFLQFDLLYPKPHDPDRLSIYGDPKLLEQLVYNLVNNAIKYSYRGTKIHLDCYKNDDGYILEVINYGLPIDIENPESIYNLYQRGNNVDGEEGIGIGLYIAHQIVKSHKGNISYTCEKISEYNVPLIESYLFLRLGDEEFKQKIKQELKYLQNINKYNEIISLVKNDKRRYENPRFFEIINSIKKPTYKVTFSVYLPGENEK